MRGLPLAVMLLASALAVFGQSQTWSLDDAIDAATAQNLELERQTLRVEETRRLLADSWNRLLPSLDASASLSRSESNTDEPWSVGLGASASVSLGPALGSEIRGLELDYRSALLDLEVDRLDLIRRVKEGFYEILLVQSRIELARQNITLAERQYEQTQELYDSGRASELELLTAQVSLETRRPELLALENDLEVLLSRMKNLTGLAPAETLAVRGELVLPEIELDAEELLSRAATSAPTIRDLDLQLAALRMDRRNQALDTKAPTLSLSYSYSPSFRPPDRETFSDPESWRGGTATLRLSIPIDPHIPRSQDSNRLMSLDYAIQRSELALEEARRSVRSDILESVGNLRGIRRTLEARELALRQAERSYQQTLAAYQLGGEQLLEVENALVRQQQARLGVLNETYNFLVTLVDLDYLTGGILTELE